MEKIKRRQRRTMLIAAVGFSPMLIIGLIFMVTAGEGSPKTADTIIGLGFWAIWIAVLISVHIRNVVELKRIDEITDASVEKMQEQLKEGKIDEQE